MTRQQADKRVSHNIPYYSSYSSCQGAFWASDTKINRVNRVAYGVSVPYCRVHAGAVGAGKNGRRAGRLARERQPLPGWLGDLVGGCRCKGK